MNPLPDALRMVGETTLPTLWVPMGAWTLFALCVLGLLRLDRRPDALTHYAARTALLASLPMSLVFAWSTEFSAWYGPPLAAASSIVSPVGSGVPIPALPLVTPSPSWTLLHALGLLTLLAAGLAVLKLALLLLQSMRLLASSRRIDSTDAPRHTDLLDRACRDVGLRRPVRLAVTSLPVPPMTYGVFRPVVVIPESILTDEEALRLALLHELVHVRRHDVLLHWLERAIGAVFAIHPVVTLIRRTLAYHREAACDAEVLRQPAVSGKRYAALLFSFATSTHAARTPAPVPALPLTASPRTLKKRILAMNSRSTPRCPTPRRLRAYVALILGTASLLVACTDPVDVQVEASESETFDHAAPSSKPLDIDGETFFVVEEMPEPVGGMAALHQAIRYPESARQAGVEGRVIVQFVVDHEGRVVDPVVVRSAGSGLDEEAVRAIREVRFTPGRQRGRTVPVKMTLPIVFRLDPSAP